MTDKKNIKSLKELGVKRIGFAKRIVNDADYDFETEIFTPKQPDTYEIVNTLNLETGEWSHGTPPISHNLPDGEA